MKCSAAAPGTHALSRAMTTISRSGGRGSTMNITSVRIIMYPKDKLRAFATITIDDWLAIRGIKIIEGRKGLFVAMPNRQRGDSTYQDIAHPITAEARATLEGAVLSAFAACAAAGNGTGY